jgi:PAS domain S-box-containing protein
MTASNHKIVVVEDEGLIAADLESRLKAAGYLVPGTADTARKALQLVKDTAPDLVLMDIRIKGDVDGIQVADQLRQEFDVPVVFLTAYEDQGTLERAGRTQAFGYIKKPIASSSLQGSIEMALAKHRYERELRGQRDWLAASFAAVPHAVVVTDGSGRIGYINSLAEELIGWTNEQALGHAAPELLRLIYRETGRPVEDFVPAAMLQGETIPFPANIWLKGADGRHYAVEGNVAPRWRDGRIEGTVIALTDTTLCQFEVDQARQDEKQEALLRLADQMMRELPDMSTLAEESVRLMDELPADSPARQNAEAIERAAWDALAVTYRIRKFLEPPEVQPGSVMVDEIVSRLETAWKQVQPNLILSRDAEPIRVQADPWQLTRVLMSVLLHARRQMAEDTEVSMEITGGATEQITHMVRIRVRYTSAQEDAAAIQRVFEPCWSGDSEDLPLTYRIVRKMGGLMSARLEDGNLVTVDMYLSRVEAAVAGAPVPAPQKPAVLLIESNPEIRRVLHVHFERHGYRLLEASDCGEGLLLARLYQAELPLILANPDNDDPAREKLEEKFALIRPASRVRVLAGYYQSCRAAAGASIETIGTEHFTKWDLLTWAQDAFRSANTQDAAV